MTNNFDEKAAGWDDKPGRVKLAKTVWSIMQNTLKDQTIKSWLDYGCGTGLLGFQATEKAELVSFCDTSDGMLDQVKQKKAAFNAKNAEVLKADFLQDALPEKKYDAVMSMLVIHHVEDVNLLMQKFASILNDNGFVIWIDLEKEDGSFHDDNSGIHHFGFAKEEISTYFSQAGIDLFSYDASLYIEKEKDGELRRFPLFVAVGRKG